MIYTEMGQDADNVWPGTWTCLYTWMDHIIFSNDLKPVGVTEFQHHASNDLLQYDAYLVESLERHAFYDRIVFRTESGHTAFMMRWS
jgi:hypothetical protein